MALQTSIYTIPAGAGLDIARQSDFLACLSCTANSFKVSFDNGPDTTMEAGLTFRPAGGFQLARLSNPNASAMTVQLGMGQGDIHDARASINTAQTMPTRQAAPDVATDISVSAVNAAVTPLVVAKALRHALEIVNSGAGTVYITANPAAVAGEGLPLAAGQPATLSTVAALYLRNDSGAACNVQGLDLAWSA